MQGIEATEDDLLKTVASVGPVAVYMYASDSFLNYLSGTYT